MRRPALGLDLEMQHALARGDDLAALARRLGDQHVFVLLRLALDQLPRGRAADLLLGDVKEGDRQWRLLTLAHEVAIGVIGEIGAALHIVDAGAVDDVSFAPEGQLFGERAHRMDRVEVTDHENARTVAAPGGPRLQNVAEAVAAGRALDPRADGRHVPLDQIDQLVDLPTFVGGGLDLHPFADAVEYLLRVDLREIQADRKSVV